MSTPLPRDISDGMAQQWSSAEISSVLERILPRVATPAQYIGREWNAVLKDPRLVDVQVALAFPDTYALGMSHLGLHILYGILNARTDCLAERVFAPWVDMEREMRQMGLPLFTLESRRPVREFDVLGFSLQYEMSYTNILTMLDLAGIPLRAMERSSDDPLVVGGGPCALSPEPVAEFFDLFVLGDGEGKIEELVEALKRTKEVTDRRARLVQLVREVSCLYAPSLYEVRYASDGTIEKIYPRFDGVPMPVKRHWVRNLDDAFVPERPVVPLVEVTHDRITLEVMRGCTHGCRFCEAGTTKRPARHRSVKRLVEAARRTYASTGYSEISLSSLSTADYPHLSELMDRLAEEFAPKAVNVSVPSLRVGPQLFQLPSMLSVVRRSGLTFAPEAGSERLRAVINKNISDADLLAAVSEAYRHGWRLVKLYFMIGLPTESDEDVNAIGKLALAVSELRRDLLGSPARVNVAVSTFVPRPHTPFQWEAMAPPEYVHRMQERLLHSWLPRRIDLNFHKAERSFLEGAFARGDRRLSAVIETAWRLGARFDGWDEHFDFAWWMDAFQRCELDPAFYALRPRREEETLPWGHIDAGVSCAFLLRERARSHDEQMTPNCLGGPCQSCGAVERDERCPSADACHLHTEK